MIYTHKFVCSYIKNKLFPINKKTILQSLKIKFCFGIKISVNISQGSNLVNCNIALAIGKYTIFNSNSFTESSFSSGPNVRILSFLVEHNTIQTIIRYYSLPNSITKTENRK